MTSAASPPAPVAWVTGASSGLGKALALQLVRSGWQVAATARSAQDLAEAACGCGPLENRIHPVPGDITDAAQMQAAVAEIEDRLGPIDLAVLNAGTHIPVTLETLSPEPFARLTRINLLGTVNCLSAVSAPMTARRRGHIAVVSSVAGFGGLPTSAAYGATKAGLINLCEALKPEYDLAGIKLQIVNPGFVRTPLTDKNDFPMPFLMEPEAAAAALMRGLQSNRFEITFPRCLSWTLKLLQVLPYPLYFAVTRRLLPKPATQT